VNRQSQRIARLAAFAGAMLLSASMAAAAAHGRVVGQPAEVTPDGLHRVQSPVLALAWFKPGVDFKRYTKVMLAADGVTFKGAIRRSNGEYPVPLAKQEQFSKMLLEVFTDELVKLNRFTVVTEPGPDVLIVRGAVLEVVSHIAPEQPGRSTTIQKSIGEATLVVELQDSESREFLARGIDRRTAASSLPRKSDAVSNSAELRHVARQWASELRQRLDEL